MGFVSSPIENMSGRFKSKLHVTSLLPEVGVKKTNRCGWHGWVVETGEVGYLVVVI